MHQQIKEIILSDSNSLYRVTSAFINYSDNIIEFDYKKYKHIYADEITGMSLGRENEYIIGRYAAQLAVENFLHYPLKKVKIKKGIFNYPYIEGTLPAVDISLSHTRKNVFAVAYSRELVIGIDCEKIDVDSTSIIYTQLTDGEKKLLDAIDNESMNAGITAFWTMKESLSKAIKTGLTVSIDLLEITEVNVIHGGLEGKIGFFSQYAIRTWIVNDICISMAYPYMLHML